jgi:hypothetical protein
MNYYNLILDDIRTPLECYEITKDRWYLNPTVLLIKDYNSFVYAIGKPQKV